MAERTARIRQAVTEPGADVDSNPSFESSGTVEFASRRVAVETRLGGEAAARLASVATAHGVEEALNEPHPMQAVFIGDEVYELGAGGRWFRWKVEWWRRPVWSLDALQAAGCGWVSGEVVEIHGIRTTCLSGSIGREQLKQIDSDWHKLLGRRAKDDLPTRVWLDDTGRAMRIAWTLPPSQLKRGDQPSWTITEFWDWGLRVTITAPAGA